jgi:hypothetical protein
MIRIFFALAVVSAMPLPALGQATLETVIEIQRMMAPGELIDFVFVDGIGGVTQQSIGDPDGDDLLSISVPMMDSSYVHDDPCSSLCMGFAGAGPGTYAGLVPLLDDGTGLSLLPGFLVTDLILMPPLTVGATIPVVDRLSAAFPVALIRAPPVPFDLIPLADWADTGIFPLFTGTAEVVELLDLTVTIKCTTDVDGDGLVGIEDFLEVLAQWGQACPCTADADDDDMVGITDFLKILAEWGPCT